MSLFYAYEFFLRLSPSILIDQLLTQYHVHALGIAGFSSSYFLGYLLMQLPAGILFDRFGIKKVASLALLVCVAGSSLFTLEHHYLLGILGRLILGAGSAFAFIGAMTLIRRYYLDNYFAALVAVVISVGTIAGAFGQVFAVKIIDYISWHLTIDGMAAWGCILALALILIPSSSLNNPPMKSQPKMRVWSELKLIAQNKQIGLNAMIGGIFYLPTSVIAGTWGVDFFNQAFHLSNAIGSFAVTVLFIGCAIGGPLSGFLAAALNHEKLVLSVSALSAALILTWLLTQQTLLPYQLYGSLFLFGFFSGAQVVIWRIFTKLVPDIQLTGAASALTNLIIMLVVAIGDLCVGKLITHLGVHTPGNGLLTSDLRGALFLLPLLLLTTPV
jgi:MFS family permease